jgi:DNA polymerase I-like protein with 3'-5' exonuclease and polymerase domains
MTTDQYTFGSVYENGELYRPLTRSQKKAINFGLIYGMSKDTVMNILGIPLPQVDEILAMRQKLSEGANNGR